MKTLLAIFLSLQITASFADRYTEIMTKNITIVYKATTMEELQTAVNAFERIAGAEKTKWEPLYYASFGYIMMATRESDNLRKDAFLDLAKTSLDKAIVIAPNESELFALEGFIHMIRVTVDAASRGPQYSMMAMQSYTKSLTINPENPRALGLLAQLQFGTAKFFNQAPTEGCETARRALALFDKEPSEISVAPTWGKGMTVELIKGCE